MASTSLYRIVMALFVSMAMWAAAPAYAKKNECGAAKTQADCSKKSSCSWDGKACAKAPKAKKAAAGKAAKKDKAAAAAKPAETKPAEAAPAPAPANEAPAAAEGEPAAEGDDF